MYKQNLYLQKDLIKLFSYLTKVTSNQVLAIAELFGKV
jgi:hypothetical protein